MPYEDYLSILDDPLSTGEQVTDPEEERKKKNQEDYLGVLESSFNAAEDDAAAYVQKDIGEVPAIEILPERMRATIGDEDMLYRMLDRHIANRPRAKGETDKAYYNRLLRQTQREDQDEAATALGEAIDGNYASMVNTGKGAAGIIGGAIEGLGYYGEKAVDFVSGGTGVEDLEGMASPLAEEQVLGKRKQNFIERLGRRASTVFDGVPIKPESEDFISRDFSQALGSTLPFMLSGGTLGVAGTTTLGGLAGSGNALQEADALGMTAEQAGQYAIAGGITGLSEGLAPEMIVSELQSLGSSGLRQAAARVARTMYASGVTEGTQEFLQGLTMRVAKDRITGENPDVLSSIENHLLDPELWKEGGTGAAVGMLLGGGTVGLQEVQNYVQDAAKNRQDVADVFTTEALTSRDKALAVAMAFPDEMDAIAANYDNGKGISRSMIPSELRGKLKLREDRESLGRNMSELKAEIDEKGDPLAYTPMSRIIDTVADRADDEQGAKSIFDRPEDPVAEYGITQEEIAALKGPDVPSFSDVVQQNNEQSGIDSADIEELSSDDGVNRRLSVVRYDIDGDIGDGANKPQGLYLNRLGVYTGVEPEMSVSGKYIFSPKNALVVDGGLEWEHRRFGGSRGPVSAGISSLKMLVGDAEFSRLMSLGKKRDAIAHARSVYPNVEWTRYYDAYEVLEGYAGMLARDAGYDAIMHNDEVVALSDDVLSFSDVVQQNNEQSGIDNTGIVELSGGIGLAGSLTKKSRPAPESGFVGEFKSVDDNVDRRLNAVRDTPKTTFADRYSKFAEGLKFAFRSQGYIPNSKEFAVANEMFRQFKEIPANAELDANLAVRSIVGNNAADRINLYSQYLRVKDAAEAARRGKYVPFDYQQESDVFADEEVMDSIFNAPENQWMRDMHERRQVLLETTVRNLLANNLLSESWLPRYDENGVKLDINERIRRFTRGYAHRQILINFSGATLEGRGLGMPKKFAPGSAKKRIEAGVDLDIGEEFDPVLDFRSSEIEFFRDAQQAIAVKQWLEDLNSFYGLEDVLKQRVEDAKDRGETSSIAREAKKDPNIEPYAPGPESIFRRAFTIADRMADTIEASIENGDIIELDPKDIFELRVALKGERYYLPTQIVKQLESMKVPSLNPTQELLNAVNQTSLEWQRKMLLLSPEKLFEFMARQVTGDIDPVVGGGAPGVLAYVPGVFKELKSVMIDGVAPSGDLLRAMRLGVTRASVEYEELTRGGEPAKALKRIFGISDAKVLDDGNRILSAIGKAGDIIAAPKNIANAYFEWIRKYSDLREGVLRYAAYKHFLDKIKAGELTGFAGSKKEVVQEVIDKLGPEVGAARLSRDLLGDYGNLTEFGNFMRNHVATFYSFPEVNMKRYAHILANIVDYARNDNDGVIKKSVVATANAAAIFWLYGLVGLWNLVQEQRDGLESDLSEHDRNEPHLTIGRYADGAVARITNVGAVGDILEWGGANNAVSILISSAFKDSDLKGDVTAEEIARHIGKSFANKMISQLRPDVKGAIEGGLGKSAFPDVFNLRPVDSIDSIASAFGLKEEVNAMIGMLVPSSPRRASPDYFRKWLINPSHPGKNAKQDVHGYVNDFLKSIGREKTQGSYKLSEALMLRRAAEYRDPEMFTKAKAQYILGSKYPADLKAPAGTRGLMTPEAKIHSEIGNTFLRNIEHFDPLGGLPKKLHQEFYANLSDFQRKKLQAAQDYAAEMRFRMAEYWVESENDPRVQAAYKKAGEGFSKKIEERVENLSR